MKIIPILRAPGVKRLAIALSFVFCLILQAFPAGPGLAQTSIPGYTPPAPKPKQNLTRRIRLQSGDDQDRRAMKKL